MEMSGGESRWRGSFLIHRCNFFRELCYGFLFTISCQKDFKEICFYKADCSGSICRRNRGLPGSFIVEMASLDNNDSFFCDGRIVCLINSNTLPVILCKYLFSIFHILIFPSANFKGFLFLFYHNSGRMKIARFSTLRLNPLKFFQKSAIMKKIF